MKSQLLIVSHVLPFPGHSGQQMRVRNKLLALQELFEVTFLTFAAKPEIGEVKHQLEQYVDHASVLPSVVHRSTAHRGWHKAVGMMFTYWTGLKASNYELGRVEFSGDRIASHCSNRDYDLVLYEYWHAVESVEHFHQRNIPCVLDMHDILWRSWEKQLRVHTNPLLRLQRHRLVAGYRSREETAWERFDVLIAISPGEAEYVRRLYPEKSIILAPMGLSLGEWKQSYAPVKPHRFIYYGGLGNVHNEREALRCYERIMPLVWQKQPDAELWLVGSNPSDELWRLAHQDSRVQVTGFVEEVQTVLNTATAVLCPFSGQFGFRSRLIEAMAIGVPVVATPDAVQGMNLDVEEGILLGDTDEAIGRWANELMECPQFAFEQSELARQQIEHKYSFEATYGQMAQSLLDFVTNRSGRRR